MQKVKGVSDFSKKTCSWAEDQQRCTFNPKSRPTSFLDPLSLEPTNTWERPTTRQVSTLAKSLAESHKALDDTKDVSKLTQQYSESFKIQSTFSRGTTFATVSAAEPSEQLTTYLSAMEERERLVKHIRAAQHSMKSYGEEQEYTRFCAKMEIEREKYMERWGPKKVTDYILGPLGGAYAEREQPQMVTAIA